MVNFKKWQIPLSLLVLIIITVFVNYQLIQIYRERNINTYLAAIIDKETILKNTPSPKIIIIGGSNVAFGFDSSLMKQKVGIPVVNTGLQGGLGIRFAMNFVKPYIKEGDILIISPEYNNILGDLNGGEVLAQLLILYPKGILSISSFNEVWELLKAFPAVHTEAIKLFFEDKLKNECSLCEGNTKIYYRSAFNPETGDITTNYVRPKPQEKEQIELIYKVPNPQFSGNIRFLDNFYEYVVSKNAKMYFVYPSLVNHFDDNTKEILQQTEIVLNQELAFPILDSVKDSLFPNDMMFDSPYHLNNQGRIIRSAQISNELCEIDPSLECQ